jgi:phosphatidylinositol glycan class T
VKAEITLLSQDLVHHMIPLPHMHLCTENLTPFLSLLPSKGLSGLSTLLAQPGIVFSWGFKAEGIEVVMPDGMRPGQWTGWWEGVVDTVPQRGTNRAFSLGSLFRRGVPKPFPEADSSILRIIKREGMSVEPDAAGITTVDARDAHEWDLLDPSLQHKDIRASWDNVFAFRACSICGPAYAAHHLSPPPVTVHRTITAPHASDGTFTITIKNNGDVHREATYSEAWPWWVKGWMSEMAMTVNGQSRE